MFRVSQAGAKGFGVFATKPIARGTRIIADRILLSVDSRDTSVLGAAARLSPDDLQGLLSLSANDAKRQSLSYLATAAWGSFPSLGPVRQRRDLLNIFYNNNFALSGRPGGRRAVFRTVARLNHSCVPNAQGNLNTALPGGQFTIHALREIADGEEITISYLHDELEVRPARQKRLREGYGFDCACEICSADNAGERHDQSHRRRLNIQQVLADFSGQRSTTDSIAREFDVTKAVIDTYEAEGLAGRELASLYFAAAGLATELGHIKEASDLGAKGLRVEEDAVGVDSPFYIASLSASRHGQFPGNRLARDEADVSSPGLSYEPWM